MRLRTPLEHVPASSYWRDTLKLLHPRMMVLILCLVTVGSFLAPVVDPVRYLLEVVGVFFGVGLCAYRLNELKDRNVSREIPYNHHRVVALFGFMVSLTIVVYVCTIYAWWLSVLWTVALVPIVVYNLSSSPWIHNKVVYGIGWGGIPVVFSFWYQSLSAIPLYVIVFGAWAGVFAVFTLYTWGTRTCGKMEICAKAGKERCHSPVLSCMDRLMMPENVSHHTGIVIDLQVVGMVLLTLGFVLLRV